MPLTVIQKARACGLTEALMTRYGSAGGPLPTIGPIRDSFWSGYSGGTGVRRGLPGSVQRRAWLAGKARAQAEAGLVDPRVKGRP